MQHVDACLNELAIPHERGVVLGPLTWYGVGGRAAVLARPCNHEQLTALVRICSERNIRVFVLGSGANLLIADEGVDGIVIRLDAPAFCTLKVADDGAVAGAGHDLGKLILKLASDGLGGLESLAGIPASVGGAVRMNAGGAFGSIGDFVTRVRVMDNSGNVRDIGRDQLRFGYRQSNIVEPFILEAEFALKRDDPGRLRERLKDILDFKKRTQPLGKHSAGCAFKNPQTPAGRSDLPNPLSAGKLIDTAGLKGFRIGGAEVSTHHANFIIVDHAAGCTAADVLAVMEHVQRTVADRFDVQLEREVVVWP